MQTEQLFKEAKSGEIKALSVKQPYAWLITEGKYETRNWETNYRGWILICSTKKDYTLDQIEAISGHDELVRILDRVSKLTKERAARAIANGKAIALARLADCRKMKKEDEAKAMVTYYPELFVWIFDQVIEIKTFDWKGQLGLKSLTPDQRQKIERI